MKKSILFFVFASLNFAFTTHAQTWYPADSSYTMGFENSETTAFSNWLIDDADANDTTWALSTASPYNGSYAIAIKQYGEDRLYSPGFALDSGVTYELSFWYKRGYPYFKDQGLLFMLGSAQTSNAVTDTLFAIDSIKINGYQRVYIQYTPSANENVFFSWQATGTSDYDYTRLYIDDFSAKKYVCDTIQVTLGKDTSFAFCRLDSLQLQANNGFAEYQWSSGNSSTSTLWITQPGTYAVQVTHSNGCIGKDTIVVSNDSKTESEMIFPDSIRVKCVNDSITLYAEEYLYSYLWTNSNADTLGTEDLLTVLDPGMYYVAIEDADGCTGADSVEVQNAQATINITSVDSTFCSNDSIAITASSGFATYNWNGTDSVSQQNTLYVKTAGTYLVEATDAHQCIWADTIEITNNAIIAAPIDSTIANKTSICLNDNTLISTMLSNQQNSTCRYEWITSSGVIDSVYADTAISVTTSGTYQVIITDTTTGCISISEPVAIQVLRPYSNQEICILNVDSATGKNQLIWEKVSNEGISEYAIYRENKLSVYEKIANVSFANAGLFTDSTANPQIRPFSYKLTAIDTCGNESELSLAKQHTSIHLAINQGVSSHYNLQWTPYVGFDYNTYRIFRDTSVLQNSPQLLDSVPASVNSFTDITPIAGVENYYYIEVLKDSACEVSAKKKGNSISSTRSNVVSTKLADMSEEANMTSNIKIYPNPAKGYVNVDVTDLDIQLNTITIENTLGQTVYKATELNNTTSTQINTAELNGGIYLLKLSNDNIQVTKKLIVE